MDYGYSAIAETISSSMDRMGYIPGLRDLFAMAAMKGLVSTAKNLGQSIDDIAKLSYQYADAMIKARQTEIAR